jgi:hypothetical protein
MTFLHLPRHAVRQMVGRAAALLNYGVALLHRRHTLLIGALGARAAGKEGRERGEVEEVEEEEEGEKTVR